MFLARSLKNGQLIPQPREVMPPTYERTHYLTDYFSAYAVSYSALFHEAILKCQGGELNSRPRAYESPALPLSYPGSEESQRGGH
jgi:hypothetical protein